MKRTPNHTHHDYTREFPRRELFQLTVAVHRAGLKDIQREWPAHGLWDPETKKWYWFDIAGVYNEKFFLIEMEPGSLQSIPTKQELERQDNKINWAASNNIPLLYLPHGYSTLEMTILVKKFLMENK